MNIRIVSGNVVKNFELQEKNGTKFAHFSIGHNEVNHETEFISVTAFGKNAEFAAKYFKQGSAVVVTGPFYVTKYTRKDGVEGEGNSLIADRLEFYGMKKNRNDEASEEK